MRTMFIAFSVLQFACGGPPSPVTDAGSSTAGGSAGGSTAGGSAGGSSAGGNASAGDADAGGLSGSVEIKVEPATLPGLDGTTRISARFGRTWPVWEDDLKELACSSRALGTCSIEDCVDTDGGMAMAAPRDLRSAGRLTIDDGSTTITADLDAGTGEYSVRRQGELTSGSLLNIEAAGDAVPRFRDTLQLPERIVVTAPSCPLQICGSFDRSRDLDLAWSNAMGPVDVQLIGVSLASRRIRIITCSFTGPTGTIPSAATQAMPEEGAILEISRRTDRTVQAGAVPVALRAVNQSLYGVYTSVR